MICSPPTKKPTPILGAARAELAAEPPATRPRREVSASFSSFVPACCSSGREVDALEWNSTHDERQTSYFFIMRGMNVDCYILEYFGRYLMGIDPPRVHDPRTNPQPIKISWIGCLEKQTRLSYMPRLSFAFRSRCCVVFCSARKGS